MWRQINSSKSSYFLNAPIHHHFIQCTVKFLLAARLFIRIITFHGDGGGHLLKATSARKVIKVPRSSNFSQRFTMVFALIHCTFKMVDSYNGGFPLCSGNHIHQSIHPFQAHFWSSLKVPYCSHKSSYSATRFEVTNARVHCIDNLAVNFVTDCLLQAQTFFKIIIKVS